MKKFLLTTSVLIGLSCQSYAQSIKFDQYDHCNPAVEFSNGNLTVSHGSPVTIMALDATAGRLWTWKSHQTVTNWGGSSGNNGNPYSGTNGLNYTPLTGTLYPQITLSTGTDVATLLASDTLLYRFAVSGFSSLDTATSATNTLTTNSGTLTYSNGNLTATGNTSGRARSDNGISSGKMVFGFRHNTISGAYAHTVGISQSGTSGCSTEVVQHSDPSGTLQSKCTNVTSYGNWISSTFHQGCGLGHNVSSSKIFFEITFDASSGNGTHPRLGWAAAGTLQLSQTIGNNLFGLGWDPVNGNVYYNSAAQSKVPGVLNVGSTALIAIDGTASPPKIWFGNPDHGSYFWNGTSGSDPITDTHHFQLGDLTYQVSFSTYAPGDAFTFNFGQTTGVNTSQISSLRSNGWEWFDPITASPRSRAVIFGMLFNMLKAKREVQ